MLLRRSVALLNATPRLTLTIINAWITVFVTVSLMLFSWYCFLSFCLFLHRSLNLLSWVVWCIGVAAMSADAAHRFSFTQITAACDHLFSLLLLLLCISAFCIKLKSSLFFSAAASGPLRVADRECSGVQGTLQDGKGVPPGQA